MTAVQAVIVVGGSLLLLTAMIAGMIRANQSERRHIERRREEWIAGGRIPEEEPNFYSGSGGGS
jgi:tRNA A37 N6-isopentenylltransferase MiaA